MNHISAPPHVYIYDISTVGVKSGYVIIAHGIPSKITDWSWNMKNKRQNWHWLRRVYMFWGLPVASSAGFYKTPKLQPKLTNNVTLDMNTIAQINQATNKQKRQPKTLLIWAFFMFGRRSPSFFSRFQCTVKLHLKIDGHQEICKTASNGSIWTLPMFRFLHCIVPIWYVT